MLVMIGRTNFTMKRLNDKMTKYFYDFISILLVADDEKLLSGSSFAHDTFDAARSRIWYLKMRFWGSLLLSGDPSWNYSTN